MTYCLGIKLDAGLVFASDSRITAGIDYISTYRKLHTLQPAPDRIFVILTSGNLGTTQELLDSVRRDLDRGPEQTSLRSVRYMFEAAHYLGQTLFSIEQAHDLAFRSGGVSGSATLILGGQIAGRAPELFLIHPEGNYVAASPETPFLQLGEFKFGKPILSRIANTTLSLNDAARLALISFDAALKSNLSVGPPIDLAILPSDALKFSQQLRLDEGSLLFSQMSRGWDAAMHAAFEKLPPFPWEAPS
ncbi:MAG: 20S proteasome subunit A/B [Steroidobacteraceae bacterium]|jgi:putative proteasome-type protease